MDPKGRYAVEHHFDVWYEIVVLTTSGGCFTLVYFPEPQAPFVVKAQIHAGGRGKGTFNTGFKGGVHVCSKYVTDPLSLSLHSPHQLLPHAATTYFTPDPIQSLPLMM